MNYIPKVKQKVIMKTGKVGIVKSQKVSRESHKPYLYIVEIDGVDVVAMPSDFEGEY